jgi:probable F420-dependent oxidoreductase
MDFGLQIAFEHASGTLRDTAQAAEELGFAAIYFPDHLVAEGPERQATGLPALDPMMQAAIVADATKRIRVGHLVLANLFRHPAVTARSLATLDVMSGGRAIAGLGTGWTETEFRMTGIPFPDITTRLRMLDEALAVIHGLWTAAPFTFSGEFYKLQDADLVPKPVQQPRPPILLGGGGKGLLRIAGRWADHLNVISDAGKAGYIALSNVAKLNDASFTGKVKFLHDEAARHGRDPKSIRISQTVFTLSLTHSPAASREMAGRVGMMLGGLPAEAVLQSPLMLIGTPEECVTELKRRARVWGVGETIFSFPGLDTLRRLSEEVLKHV